MPRAPRSHKAWMISLDAVPARSPEWNRRFDAFADWIHNRAQRVLEEEGSPSLREQKRFAKRAARIFHAIKNTRYGVRSTRFSDKCSHAYDHLTDF